eukprot:scaffold1326_cov130-Skeletonema_dohrnii-CCMP3373.AAC.1
MYIVDKNLWDKENYGAIKHTAVLAGRPALSAGEAYFKKNGVIWGINYSSGHYRPKVTAVTMMYQWMKDQGLNTSAFNWVARKQWSTKDCYETDWKSFEIHAFDVRVLEKTCREEFAPPTQMSPPRCIDHRHRLQDWLFQEQVLFSLRIYASLVDSEEPNHFFCASCLGSGVRVCGDVRGDLLLLLIFLYKK